MPHEPFPTPPQRGRVVIPIGARFGFLNQLLAARGAPPLPARFDDSPPPPILPPGPDRPPPEVPFPDRPPVVPPGTAGPGGFIETRGSPVRFPTGPAVTAPSLFEVLTGIARVIGRGPLVIGGIFFPSEVSRGVPTEEVIERELERGFEPTIPEILPEIVIPRPEVRPARRVTLPSRRPQRVTPVEPRQPLPAIPRRPFTIPPEFPPGTPEIAPGETPRVQPFPFEIPEVTRPEIEQTPEVPELFPQPAPVLPSRSPAPSAPQRTSTQPIPRRTAPFPGRQGISPLPFLIPPFPLPTGRQPRIAPRTRSETSPLTPTQTPPAEVFPPPSPLTPSNVPRLDSTPRQSNRQCEEVKRRRRRKGKCREGFFRELPGKTQFITWREGDCVGIARKGAAQAVRDELESFATRRFR